jgi:hypothetical protein
VKHLHNRSSTAIASLLTLFLYSSSAFAHHGPSSIGEDGSFHPLHLGKAQLADPNGKMATYGIRADNSEILSFTKPWFGCSLIICSTPFTIPTTQIIAFGPGAFDDKSASSAESALTVGLAVVAPLLLIPLGVAKGQSNFQYTLAVFSGNGRINVRSIRLYSSDDVEHLTKYLENATAKKAGDQPTNAELQKLRDNILSEQDSELDKLFKSLEIDHRTRTQWCKEGGSMDNNEITESIKEKVDYHNETRKASGLEPVSIDSIYKRSRCKAHTPAGDSRGSTRQLDRQ